MRSLAKTGTTLLTVVLMTGCGAELGPTSENGSGITAAGTHHDRPEQGSFNEPFDEVFVSPCNGDTIVMAGRVVGRWNLVEVMNRDTLHYEIHLVLTETGSGLPSGATYTLHNVLHEGFNAPTATSDNVNFTFREKAHFTSSMQGLGLTIESNFHFVGLPGGGFKITRDAADRLTCRG